MLAVAGDHAGSGDAVFPPCRGALGQVQHHWREPVDGHHEPGFGRIASFVLVPQLTKSPSGGGREQAEEAFGGGLFSSLLRSGSLSFVVGECVAGVDLDDVVHEGHGHGDPEVDRLAGERGQDQGGDPEVP